LRNPDAVAHDHHNCGWCGTPAEKDSPRTRYIRADLVERVVRAACTMDRGYAEGVFSSDVRDELDAAIRAVEGESKP
jgi:hypothetical protein